MTEKFEIKIVRLRTGEDLIGFYHQDKETNTVILKYPKTFYPTIDVENETEEIIAFALLIYRWSRAVVRR